MITEFDDQALSHQIRNEALCDVNGRMINLVSYRVLRVKAQSNL